MIHNKFVIHRMLLGVAPAVLFSSISLTATAADVHIKIYFDESSCPKGVDLDGVEVRRGQDRIVWTSYNQDGSTKIDETYSIYFDPFRGRPLSDSDANGVVTSPPVDQDAPPADYKYTVWGKKCVAEPLDPNIRVR